MPKFRKKPVVIEAWQWTGGHPGEHNVPQWVAEAFNHRNCPLKNVGEVRLYGMGMGDLTHIQVLALEGLVTGPINTWLMQGVRDELYLCKPDIFAETYDAVDEDTTCQKSE